MAKPGYPYEPIEPGKDNPAGRFIPSHAQALSQPGTQPSPDRQVEPSKLNNTPTQQRAPTPGGLPQTTYINRTSTFKREPLPQEQQREPGQPVRVAPSADHWKRQFEDPADRQQKADRQRGNSPGRSAADFRRGPTREGPERSR